MNRNYRIRYCESNGYIVFSVDNEIKPIIAYSLKQNFNWDNSGDNFLLDLLSMDMRLRLEALPLLSEERKKATCSSLQGRSAKADQLSL